MIGEIFDEHTRQDIVDAQSLKLDAFALNFNQFASWSNNTVDRLFDNADDLGFGLFFSFDMAPGYFSSPSEYSDYLKGYLTRDSYFEFNGKPLVSTFGGEDVSNADWADFKSSVGDVLVIPGFYEATPSTTFFDSRSSLDGVFNWNSWPFPDEGKANASTTDDSTFMSAAHSASKLFMMGISPLQFKHLDTSNNWYRRGEGNLENRLLQALELQPDMIELQTWNDAGESHYMGNLWDEPMTGSVIHNYVDGYDHKGYWEILSAFIQAYKRGDTSGENMVPTNGKTIQGAYWHHTLLVDGDCSSDPLKKPGNVENVEDAVSGVILVAKEQTGLVGVVNSGSGSKELGKINLVEGYNAFKFDGLTAGKVTVEVWDGSTMVGGGYGPLEASATFHHLSQEASNEMHTDIFKVASSASICNYNFQVVGFPG
jgi:hypothetical protein